MISQESFSNPHGSPVNSSPSTDPLCGFGGLCTRENHYLKGKVREPSLPPNHTLLFCFPNMLSTNTTLFQTGTSFSILPKGPRKSRNSLGGPSFPSHTILGGPQSLITLFCPVQAIPRMTCLHHPSSTISPLNLQTTNQTFSSINQAPPPLSLHSECSQGLTLMWPGPSFCLSTGLSQVPPS